MDQQFKDQVFEIIRMIPKGRVTSYGAIAKAVGYPNHSRHVGNALRHYDADFPAHRVCNSSGVITAEDCIPDFTKKLAKEGVAVKGNKIQNFRKIFWDPLNEI
ncbi:MGMT family protein [Elizabethkingia sp. HX WHF]|jgi:methylated-DNA-protein-cysteine methyltransferase-like protein|uniref:MGMT family protein n=2 Tax=Elizabethkingia TaxID=308865 RepID=A0A7T7ZZB0_9FLAO|nr:MULTISPECIES: MGMT family protein [Elizabethkingia]AQX86141.1 cysteine methyltransferase [Elizabethkingia bruuniana]ATL45014.1 cysteine methyltransferase [Elizabethkingia miricola]KGO09107.1 cysteine methyltransferase [Elizabethkingia miricola]KUY24653.1 cysteine methyltransferase [Elizabethkingia bruuniana]MCL1636776.1 MGMT family protein [Elizabethkingia bruuniana]